MTPSFGQMLLTRFVEMLRGSHLGGLRLETKATNPAMGQAIPVLAHQPAAKKGAQR